MPVRTAPRSRLRRYCDAQGVKYSWLAARLGLSASRLGNYDTGRRTPPADFYDRAAVVLGVPVDWIAPPERVADALLDVPA